MTYWQRLLRVVVAIPLIWMVVVIIGTIGATLFGSYLEWEWQGQLPNEVFMGIYNWFVGFDATDWRVFIVLYPAINMIIAFYYHIIFEYFDTI